VSVTWLPQLAATRSKPKRLTHSLISTAGDVRLYCTDHHPLPLPPGNRFPISKYRPTRELLAGDGLYEFIPAPLADRAVLESVHDQHYVEQFLSGTLSSQAIRRIGFPWLSAERWQEGRITLFVPKVQASVSSTTLPLL
jgi:acetoin utilization deacetylase AcuC-like enzyme